MSKILAGVAILFALVLIVPPLISALRDNEPAAEPAEEAVAPEEPSIPSPEEAPPLWDAQRLAGTAWRLDFSQHPDEELQAMENIQHIEFHFTAPGQVRMEMGRDEEDGENPMPMWMKTLTSAEGSYEVNGPQMDLRLRTQMGWSEETIDVRGEDLYFSGVSMTRIN